MGVFGQRYDRSGAAAGGEFQVNTVAQGDQTAGGVAMAADGRFVVAGISHVLGYEKVVFVLDTDYDSTDIARIDTGVDYTAVLVVNSEGPLIEREVSGDLPLSACVLVWLLPDCATDDMTEFADYVIGLLPEYDPEKTLAEVFVECGIKTFAQGKMNQKPRGKVL